MTGTEFIARVFPYLAVGLFTLGTAWRLMHWWSQPPHLKWTLYPVPVGMPDQLKYMAREIFTFGTLYRFNRRLWIGTYALHMAMGGFMLSSLLNIAGWTTGLPVKVFLWVLLLAVLYISIIRIADRNLRTVSSGEEFFNLFFLGVVAAAGLFASAPPGSFALRHYLLSLMLFNPDVTYFSVNHLPAVLFGGLFLIYLPWSKMIHYVAKYFTYHRINWQKHG